MADLDDIKDGKDWGRDRPADTSAILPEGAGAPRLGMKARMARIFRPDTGRTVMLAFDHGYFQGPTTGLERLDLTIAPLVPHTDVLMARARRPAHLDPAGIGQAGGAALLGRELDPDRTLRTNWSPSISRTRSGWARRPWRRRSISARNTNTNPSPTW